MRLHQQIADLIDRRGDFYTAMADAIFDAPELSFEEKKASAMLSDALKALGFEVELGLGRLPTAFRAVWSQGAGGPRIGLLCEYDALPMGHGCGHHMQGPAIVAAAEAVKEAMQGEAYSLVVYGTPAEEGGAGKLIMLEDGCFQDIDMALMMHGGPATQVDVKSMAMQKILVTFHGKSAHAALKPDAGRSALDALLLAFQGTEFLREHVKEDTRMHYTVVNAGGPENVTPSTAAGSFTLRSYNTDYLQEVVRRFSKVVEGAAIMTETTYDMDIDPLGARDSKVPAHHLNALLMEAAQLYQAPNIRGAREKTGSTDFGNVTYRLPGACLRVAFVDDGVSSHSQGFLDEGKTERAHAAVRAAAKILALTVCQIIQKPEHLRTIREEFSMHRENMKKS